MGVSLAVLSTFFAADPLQIDIDVLLHRRRRPLVMLQAQDAIRHDMELLRLSKHRPYYSNLCGRPRT